MPSVAQTILFKQLKVEGFMVTRWPDKVPQAIKDLTGWIEEVRERRKCVKLIKVMCN